jgi:cell shape-determining protein MreC
VVVSPTAVVRHNATIVSRRAAGAKTELVLNKGSAHGVHVGNTGSIGGFSFKVIQVYAVRCKVRVNATLAQLTGKKNAIVKAH